MALPATDNFNRSGPGLGSNWTTISLPMQIDSNQVGPGSTGGDGECCSAWNADSFNANQYSQVTVTQLAENLTAGVAVRAASGNYYGYYLGAPGDAYLFKYVGGTWTQLRFDAGIWVVGDVLRLEVEGTSLRVYRNGTIVGSAVTDSSISSGAAGLSGWNNFGLTRVDNWEGGNLGGGSPPTAPTGLSATPASATQINLAWTDNATDETAYTVERSAAGAGSWSVLTSSLAAGTTSYNDTTASANTAYDYRVKATNGSGSSSYATASNARTFPGAPTGLSATAASSSQINLSWSAPSGGVTSYKVERSPTGSGSWTEIATGVAGTSYSSTGLSASTTYYYRVRATNATGDGAYSGNANATTTSGAPGQVTGLAAAAASTSAINLSWSATAGATSYKVERSAAGAGSWSQIASGVTATTYQDTGRATNTSYDYRVRATNASGDGSYSATATGATLPGQVTGLSATAASSSQINLSWSAPSGGATSYKVERSPTGSGSWSEIATGVAGTSYSSTGLSASTTYYYRVRATGPGGDGAYSSNANATTASGGGGVTAHRVRLRAVAATVRRVASKAVRRRRSSAIRVRASQEQGMPLDYSPKDPSEGDWFVVDFGPRLNAGETLSSPTANVESGDVTIAANSTAVSGQTVQARHTGGTGGTTAVVRYEVDTSTSRHLVARVRYQMANV